MRIFTSQKNRKQIVSLIVDFFLEELTVADPLLCVSFSSTSFHLIPIKTNRWFNIKFDWLSSKTYLEIRCCKNKFAYHHVWNLLLCNLYFLLDCVFDLWKWNQSLHEYLNGWLHVVFQCHGQLTTYYNRSWFFFYI